MFLSAREAYLYFSLDIHLQKLVFQANVAYKCAPYKKRNAKLQNFFPNSEIAVMIPISLIGTIYHFHLLLFLVSFLSYLFNAISFVRQLLLNKILFGRYYLNERKTKLITIWWKFNEDLFCPALSSRFIKENSI